MNSWGGWFQNTRRDLPLSQVSDGRLAREQVERHLHRSPSHQAVLHIGRHAHPRSWPGKVLLSDRPEREVIRLSRIGFAPYTSHTIVRVDLLLEELARVRKRGFATAFGEHEPMVNALAVPVFDQHAFVVAALEVRAAGNRIQASRIPELIERIREAAAVITEHIGGVVASNLN